MRLQASCGSFAVLVSNQLSVRKWDEEFKSIGPVVPAFEQAGGLPAAQRSSVLA